MFLIGWPGACPLCGSGRPFTVTWQYFLSPLVACGDAEGGEGQPETPNASQSER